MLPLQTTGYLRLVEAHITPITVLTQGESRMWPLLLLHFAELAFFHLLKPTLEVLFAVSMQITLPELRRPWEYAPQDRLGTMFNLRRKAVRQRGKEEKILQTTVEFRPVSFCSRICNVTGYLLCLRPLRGKGNSNNDSVIVSNPQKKKQCRSNCCGSGQPSNSGREIEMMPI